MANLPSSFSYRVRVNDAESEDFRVEVLPPPVVTNLVLDTAASRLYAEGPADTGGGELVLLRGSRLRVAGEANEL